MSSNLPNNPENSGELLLCQTEDGLIRLEAKVIHETIWLTQHDMSELFQTSSDNISLHLKNIYQDAELDEAATTEAFSVVQIENTRQVSRTIRHYNLDAIIAVGYHVNSKRSTQLPLL